MALSEIATRNLKPKAKRYRVSDDSGLYLEVSPKGKKSWLLRYAFDNKRRIIKLGEYPAMTLTQARAKRDQYRAVIGNGTDPADYQQEQQEERQQQQRKMSFHKLFLLWHSTMAESDKWTPSHAEDVFNRMEKHVLPFIGEMPADEVKPVDIIHLLKKREAAGTIETLKRIHQYTRKVFSYGVVMGYCEQNPASMITREAFISKKASNFPFVTDAEQLRQLLLAIDTYIGDIATHTALKLAPYVFLRPQELARLEWQEVDLSQGMITINASRMKKRRTHLVPLSTQALTLIEKMAPFRDKSPYVFPSPRSPQRPINQQSLNAGIRRIGFGGIHSMHGFRHTASTLLNELGYNPDWIEKQLSHEQKNTVRGVYNKAQYLKQRAKMLQDWANYLDNIKHGGQVTPIRQAIK